MCKTNDNKLYDETISLIATYEESFEYDNQEYIEREHLYRWKTNKYFSCIECTPLKDNFQIAGPSWDYGFELYNEDEFKSWSIRHEDDFLDVPINETITLIASFEEGIDDDDGLRISYRAKLYRWKTNKYFVCLGCAPVNCKRVVAGPEWLTSIEPCSEEEAKKWVKGENTNVYVDILNESEE